ncbi:tetratricopeptide repeat protein [Nitritalea halalkaliphila]|uniref:tetratricopeptide repeat protein n=1 Tax=Nitritalea halalkaliphila TaxID=590849 RepID=UPI0002EFEA62|nr:tetratricopeptide repeat protein [Nitritalea halalkaliphila]
MKAALNFLLFCLIIRYSKLINFQISIQSEFWGVLQSAEEKIGFNLGDNQTQEISLRAAALNLKGLVYVAQGSKSDAVAAFQEALALEPEFRLAQENLKENS